MPTDPLPRPNGRIVPGEIQAAARVCWPAICRQRFDPSCNSLMYGTGDYHWQNMLRKADELERQARAARVCGEWLRTAPDPLAQESSHAF